MVTKQAKAIPLYRQILAIALLLLFGTFQYLQFHHHDFHSQTNTIDKKNSISSKCEICNFVLKKQNSFLNNATLLSQPMQWLIVKPVLIFHLLIWERPALFHAFNKGPPIFI